MNTNRRKFLRDASLTATGLCLTSQIGARKKELRTTIIKCAPNNNYALLGTVSTVQSGNWSSPGTWGGKLPGPSDIPLISSGHTVIFDLSTVSYAGVSVSSGATLQFDSNNSCTLQTSGNVVVQGKLQMQPSSASVVQLLQFININESAFVGGGMDVMTTDVGLWVMGTGVLDIVGTPKTAYVRAAGNIAAGTTTISLNGTPSGWQAGDDITIAPTEAPQVGDAYLNGFEDRKINSISGSSLTLNASTVRVHPQINNAWSAEVINLTRNVRIEGTTAGRMHIFIRSSVPQTIKNAQVRYAGPRQMVNGISEFILGRYGIHFHHCDNGSVGSLVEGCVIRNCDNRSYVPHASNGITMKGNVAYNVTEIAFWWDLLDLTHGIVWDGNVVAMCKYIPQSSNSLATSGFILGVGDDNVCTNNVVIGNTGDHRIGGAYLWDEGDIESAWVFNNNMAHNCNCGLVSWQNNERHHVIEDFILYNNDFGIYHGAYVNAYLYRNGQVYNSEIMVKAASENSNRLKFENLVIDAAGRDYGIILEEGPINGPYPIFIRNCTLTGHKKAGIVNESPVGTKKVDIIMCTTAGLTSGFLALQSSAVDYYLSPDAGADENMRVQPASGQPYVLTHAGKTNIAPFAPTVWGNGNGLKGEYYSDANLSNLVFTKIDTSIAFLEWMRLGVHYKIPGNTYSMRWTGQVMAQFSEAYTFQLSAGGGRRLWVNGQLIINSWQEDYPSTFNSTPITLTAGEKYDIKLEYFNNDDRSTLGLFWMSPSTQLEYIPMSQLFATPVSQPPGNVAPVAIAGTDITITLPTNSVSLDGSASRDSDGTIATYVWTKIAGPSQFSINSAGTAVTTVTGLAAGVYVFRLTVTDDKGATGYDDVTVTVKAANLGPVANAGSDITMTLPANNATLNGGASSDPDGTIVTYSWTKISGPSTYTIANAGVVSTALTGLVAGTYVFRLTVTDDKGATATDDVNVIVNNVGTPPNQPPVANAGTDVAITLPVNSVSLNGSASSDPDGTIAKYAWSKVSGPTQFLINSPGSAITVVSNLAAGTYVFRLTVTDDKGATANDDITVVVNDTASPGNQVPLANAGVDITVQLPTAGITLDGTASYDPDGTIISYKWVKISGPTQFTLSTPGSSTTVLSNMVAGVYIFRLTVTDDKGATGSDTVTVTVLGIKSTGQLTVKVMRNPSPSVFTMEITSPDSEKICIRIFDTTGKLVTKMNNVSNNATVTVGAFWRAGMYTAVVSQGAQRVVVKLLKQ